MKFKFNPLDWAMVAIAALVIGSIIFQSCRPVYDKVKPGTVTVPIVLDGYRQFKWGPMDDFIVVVIDSCEYLMSMEPTRGDYTVGPRMLTHKGNCRYCLERQNKINFSKWSAGYGTHIGAAPDGDSAVYIDIDTTKIYMR